MPLKTSRKPGLRRRAFFIDDGALRSAKKALGVATDAEVVRLSVDRVREMERFWRFMRKTRGSLRPGSFRTP